MRLASTPNSLSRSPRQHHVDAAAPGAQLVGEHEHGRGASRRVTSTQDTGSGQADSRPTQWTVSCRWAGQPLRALAVRGEHDLERAAVDPAALDRVDRERPAQSIEDSAPSTPSATKWPGRVSSAMPGAVSVSTW